MAFWDFVKDAGKSVFGSAEAAEAKTPEQADTERKVKALEAEVKALGLDSGDVHLTLRGDTVKVESKWITGWFRVEKVSHRGDYNGTNWGSMMELIEVQNAEQDANKQ